VSQQATESRLRLPNLKNGPQIVAVLLVFGLLVAMAIQPTRQLVAQKERIAGMTATLHELQRMNDRLEKRIERFQDPDFLEQQARQQAGLVRPGEIPYVVVPPSAEQRAKRLEARQKVLAAQVAVEEPGLIESFLEFVGFI